MGFITKTLSRYFFNEFDKMVCFVVDLQSFEIKADKY